MDSDHYETLARKVADLERGHNEIRSVLTGDMSGKSGVMQYLLKLMDDVYGAKDDKASGAIPRLLRVEEQQKKWIYMVGGGAAVGGGIVGVLLKIFWH